MTPAYDSIREERYVIMLILIEAGLQIMIILKVRITDIYYT